jgi:hypothetical protein
MVEMERNLVDKAIEYAERGWKVFPLHSMKGTACSCGSPNCASAAKHPHIKEWQKYCSSQVGEIKDWWQKWPDANIGLATGKASGFFVLDIDPRHGGKESLQKLVKKNGILPKTLASSTGGGGYHLFFNEPEIRIGNRANVLPGLDVRGDGGYVVAPPSFHKSGMQYCWLKDFAASPIIDAPQWLLNLSLGKDSSRPVVDFSSLGSVGEGGRNNFLTREAGKLRRQGLEQDQLLMELRKINNAHCMPPLEESELTAICGSVARYPSGPISQAPATSKYWSEEPKDLDFSDIKVPALPENLLPERLKLWIMDVSDRMQVSPEFVMAPALVSFSSVVGRKIGVHPKKQDDWLVVPNLWGAIVARPGYFKSPTIAEAMKPLEQLSERSRIKNESNQHQISASKMIASMQLEALKDHIKKAIKEADYEQLEHLKDQVAQFEKESEEADLLERRYKTNDATVEKVARLLNENPNGLLLLRDELNGWLQTLNKAGREGDREFYLESWNGYGSYTVDRVGSGTLHVPALCLSVFGGIQPGKLQAYVEKTMQCSVDDDGLLQRFQLLIYPELSPQWKNIDRIPNLAARESVYEVFNHVDSFSSRETGAIPGVRFSEPAQEAFNVWRQELESRLRSNEIGCSAFESHLAKYRSLMPSLALLFWILEDPNHIHGGSAISLSATTLAIRWCDFLEKHALKAYRIGQSAEALAIKKLAECIEQGLVPHASSVRSIYRRQWGQLKTPQLVEQALDSLEDLNWLRVVQATVQGGKSKRIMIHPKFRSQVGGAI